MLRPSAVTADMAETGMEVVEAVSKAALSSGTVWRVQTASNFVFLVGFYSSSHSRAFECSLQLRCSTIGVGWWLWTTIKGAPATGPSLPWGYHGAKLPSPGVRVAAVNWAG